MKDLTFAILMSNNTDGSVAVNANWDNVAETMTSWGYNFTKSAMCKFPASFDEHGTARDAFHVSRRDL